VSCYENEEGYHRRLIERMAWMPVDWLTKKKNSKRSRNGLNKSVT